MASKGVVLLRRFLRDEGIRKSEFAERVGCTRPLVTMWMKEDRTPGLRMAFAIEKATNGKVPASVWSGRRSAA